MSEKTTRRRLFRPPLKYRSEGAAGMTVTGTLVVIGIVIIGFIMAMVPLPILVKASVMLVLIVFGLGFVVSFQGRTIWELMLGGIGRARQVSDGEAMYRAGPFTSIPHGTPIPGLGVTSRVIDVHPTDGGEPFAMIQLRSRRLYTVVLRAWPQGREWDDESRKDLRVQRLGDTIAFLAQTADVLAIVSVIETVPESGQMASATVRARLAKDAPDVVKQSMVEAVEEVPTAEVRGEARIAITLEADTSFRKRDPEAMGIDITRRLRRIMDYFETAGVPVRPMLGFELAATVRRSFSPGQELQIERGLCTGEPMEIPWEDAGPVSASDQHGVYIHDGCQSVSWTLEKPPEATFDSQILSELLLPRADLPRKRVILIWEPYTPAEATTIVNRDDRDARQALRQTIGSQISERAIVRNEQASAAKYEQARGAGMTRMSMIVTATVPAGGDVAAMEAMVTNLTSAAALKMRPAKGQQGPAFLAGLGIGILLPQEASTTDRLAA